MLVFQCQLLFIELEKSPLPNQSAEENSLIPINKERKLSDNSPKG